MILEDDPTVGKWFKPAKGQFQIFYRHEHQDHSYEPDFAIETNSEKLLCEPKRSTEMDDEVVLAKARAAIEWCQHATEHAKVNGGKPWSYVMMPHDAIDAAATMDGLLASYRPRADAAKK